MAETPLESIERALDINQRVLLTGPPGCGLSTLATRLSDRNDCVYVDLDTCLTKEELVLRLLSEGPPQAFLGIPTLQTALEVIGHKILVLDHVDHLPWLRSTLESHLGRVVFVTHDSADIAGFKNIALVHESVVAPPKDPALKEILERIGSSYAEAEVMNELLAFSSPSQILSSWVKPLKPHPPTPLSLRLEATWRRVLALLSDVEKQAFLQFQVFQGDFTLEAVNHVVEVSLPIVGVLRRLRETHLLETRQVGSELVMRVPYRAKLLAHRLQPNGVPASVLKRYIDYIRTQVPLIARRRSVTVPIYLEADFEAVARLAQEENDSVLEVECLYARCRAHLNRPETAPLFARLVRLVHASALALPPCDLQLEAIGFAANAQAAAGDYVAAEASLREVLPPLDSAANPTPALLSGHIRLGHFMAAQENRGAEAIAHLEECLNVPLGSEHRHAHFVTTIQLAYAWFNHDPHAPQTEEYCRKAIDMGRDFASSGSMGSVHFVVGLVRCENAQYLQALVHLQKCVDVYRSHGDTILLGHATASLARALRLTGAAEDGERRANEALEIATSVNDPEGLTLARVELGQAALGRGALLEARRELGEARASAMNVYDQHVLGLLADLASSVTEQERPTTPETLSRVQIEASGAWFEVDGERVELTRRRALRRVLAALQEASVKGGDLSVEELFEAGWPGENIAPESANKRVYTAIWTLRNLGLDDVLQTSENGYRLRG